MTLVLQLAPELEQRLNEAAQQKGLPADAFTLQLLEQSLPPKDRQKNLSALLQEWCEGDEAEQKETGEYLIRALDEDRLGYRKLFPPELKGVSW